MSDVILKKKGHTGILIFNKEATLNAMCQDFISKINEALDAVEEDSEIYTLIMTGSGRSFIAGADIDEMYHKDESEIWSWASLACDLNMRIENLKIPVIAAINGYALGGGLELALACDIRIASEKATMGLPEVKLGVICGSGGTQRLPAIVGAGIAKEMIFTAKVIDAAEALSIGMVNKVVTDDMLMDAALELCHTIEKNGQLAVRAAKEAINHSRTSSIQEGCLFERNKFAPLFKTEDQKIGMSGFLSKKKNIEFKNR